MSSLAREKIASGPQASGAAAPGAPATADILMVDDRPENLLALEAILAGVGRRLVKANSGPEALKRLLAQDFAVILLDVQMPGMDGFETARFIRQRDRSRHTPIIFLTAYDRSEAAVAKGYSVGAVDFLFKPLVPEILKSKVAVFVELFHKTDEIRLQAEQIRLSEQRELEAKLVEQRRHWESDRLREEVEREKERATQLQRLERDRWLLLQSSGEGIYGVDMNGNCTFLNAAGARILGVEAADMLGKHMHELTHHTKVDGSPYPAEECPIYQSFKTGIGCRIDNELFWRLDGSSFPVEYSSYPIVDQDKVDGAVVTFSDITERQAAREELTRAKVAAEFARAEAESANRAKSQFLANMSHELRTPLNAVIMYSELLQEEAADEGVQRFIPDLEKIRNAGRHLLSLVNGVLDLSKIEAGRMELYEETFEICPLIQDVASTVQPLADRKSNKLEVHCPANLGTMYADVTKVRQVLLNLLSNACKFTEQGTVRIDVERNAVDGMEWVRFGITDSGIGMTAEQIGKLFQPFSQADASTTRKFGGTGLGLAISKRFCEMMGGQIQVTSEAGKGSTFTVHLPASVGAGANPMHDAEGMTVARL